MHIPLTIKRQLRMQYLLRNTAAALLVLMVPTIAVASSWSPTLLVNTEAFQTIDDGDGSSNIELRFGATGSGLILNVTENQFEFDTDLEVQGTASGRKLHAQDDLTSSGTLVVEGKATFGSSIVLNGVEYIFPFGDASSTGKILASDGAGNLTWTSAGSTPNVFQTLSVSGSGQSDVVSDEASDTLTFAEGANVTITTNAGTDTITIAATDTNQQTTFTLSGDGGGSDQTISHGNTLEIAGGDSITTTASATDTLTVDITDDTVDFAELADSLTVDAATTISLGSNNFNIDATSTGEFRVEGTASGTRLHADTALTSSGTLAVDGAITFRSLTSCTNLTTNSAGVLACNNTDYIEESELTTEAHLETQITDVTNFIIEEEINTESELEALLGDVSNVLTNNDSTTDLTEGTNLYFTDERVDDRINAAFRAGSGITFNYDDTNNTFTVNTGFSSGAQVSLSPEYAGAVYYGDGANNVGQMVLAYDSTNKENYYKWTSTVSTLQDYNIAIRVKVPDEFTHWDGTAPIQFRYRTNAASADDNQMDVTMLDTAGSSVSLTGGTNFANTSWTTATITGPEAAGTYTPGSYVTIIIAMQARTTNSGEAHAGFLNLNWSTKKR
ncbi:MAG: hypothetical protein HOG89_04645 [Candidatus Peribacter sp.]|jgi:hypothetical protein|nr:hypothetical protein [Candidatus Peribacter sp.]MBT4393531.1 hypothetical protein [Candidatus Peribacter sp.]MBT4601252.1 hypothetical protein [Candidatus Peribacter sp.]MBT5149301.1 hypothetical protein [Candidatus Peribacter sp.]MBT5638272.1 hypothetical protein [Candidatus Peribacter sp.]